MKRITLQPRLRLLAEMTPHGGRLADIGTDHGYLPVWLLQEGRIPSAIAADVGAQVRANFDKLMGNQSRIAAAKAAGKAVNVSADDFNDED